MIETTTKTHAMYTSYITYTGMRLFAYLSSIGRNGPVYLLTSNTFLPYNPALFPRPMEADYIIIVKRYIYQIVWRKIH